jgi:polyisoprenoid-binding protein YceI
MKQKICRLVILGLGVAALSTRSATSQSTGPVGSPVEVKSGTVSFEVATNMFGTTVRGKSSELTARTVVHDGTPGASDLRLEQVEASVPVESLKTGISLRDRHMLKYIFRTPNGALHDVRFTTDKAECPRREASAAYACVASGLLTIRGTSRPFAMTLEIEQDGDRYRVKGDGKVALSAFGIARPSQLGVAVEDEVKIHAEFSARRSLTTTARVPSLPSLPSRPSRPSRPSLQ